MRRAPHTQGVGGMLLSFEGGPGARQARWVALAGASRKRILQQAVSEGRREAWPGAYLENCIVAMCALSSRYEGHAVDALAPEADEGRGRLR